VWMLALQGNHSAIPVLLKMICLYLDTPIIGHKFCSFLLNKLDFQRELQTSWQIIRIGSKSKNTTTTKTKTNIQILVRAGNRTWDLWLRRLMRYPQTTEKTEPIAWRLAIQLFQCYMLKHKPNQICGPHFRNQVCFLLLFVIFLHT